MGKPPRAITGFINIFEANGKLCFGMVHTTQAAADADAAHVAKTSKLIDCIQVAYSEKD